METIRQFPWILILVSITCHLCRADVDTDTRNNGDDVIQLSMMNNSAAYIYTQSKESDMLATEYLRKEREVNEMLEEAWTDALSLRQTDPRLSKVPVPRGLREEHVVAIIAYTRETPFYSQFNAAVRMYGANDSVYAEKFAFKSFQYLLSVAIERLREVLGKTPQPTYRKMQKECYGEVRSRMKFGYFASSSRKQGSGAFGNKTRFTIFSQYGAQIENYSSFPGEEEVLIPPYEAFKITSYEPRTDGVDISLETDGEAGTRVRVERGSEGEMRVLRCEGTAIFPMAWLSTLALLAHFSL
ncbi:GPI-linked NAD(P)(+)--arginine ADP-ribosyltransferase 1-like [Mobula birostris]|uniref:GPI-linked NAD(P)(+)--arginine ADP-ribosyltransferase 1-like n=1 Tax=Mobula birostris TaxID=1983395 RepID=UPI003B289192